MRNTIEDGNPPEWTPRHGPQGSSIRVLLAGGSAETTQPVSALVEDEGYSATMLPEGDGLARALELLRSERFDVAVLDLALTHADELAVVEQLHARAPELPIVVITGRDDDTLALNAVRLGAQDYLIKSRINTGVLRRVLRFAVERHRRREAEQALRRGEEGFRALIEHSSDLTTVLEADGTIRYESPSVERILGYAAADCIGLSAFDVVHPEDRPDAEAAFRRLLKTSENACVLECRVRHQDGSWRTLQSTSRNLLHDPAVSGLVINSHDITERVRAEAERKRTVSLLRATLEATTDGVLVVDHEGQVTSCNEQFARMWSIPAPLLRRGKDRELLKFVCGQLKDPEQFLARVQELYLEPEKENFDIVEFLDGRVFERFSIPQRINGRAVGRVWIFRDITERLRLEEQLRQAQKMEAVGQLAGGVAHDFNNLLTAITGTTELLLEDLPADAPEHEELRQIQRAANRGARLTRQLLAFGRRQVLQPEVLSLNALVRGMEHRLQHLVGEHIRLELRLDAALRYTRVDPQQMEQVIVDLALNARDAMPKGGTLQLRTVNVDTGTSAAGCAASGGHCVHLVISDTGTGMDEEVQSHLFEPFFTTKETGQGTGLGLATVYGTVTQSGGSIRVDSTPGKGAAVTICLPAVADSVGHSSLAAAAARDSTILLAEDEDAVRRVARRILEREGYQVLEAASAEQALEVAREHGGPIHLLLTDVVMPGKNGPELASCLLRSRPDLKVVYMSGFTRDAFGEQGVNRPGTLFIQKPFERRELLQKIHGLLGAG